MLSSIGLSSQKDLISPKIIENQHLLNNYPGSIHIQSGIITDLMNRAKGEDVFITSSENIAFAGTVIQNVKWNENAQTLVLQLKGFPDDTKLIINKVFKDSKTVYRGHILNLKYSDAYQIISYNETEFVFSKTSTKNIVTE
jgi:hypothetical protein